MYLTDVYKIEEANSDTWYLRRAIYPRLFWYWGIAVLSGILFVVLWDRSRWEPYVIFFGLWFAATSLSIPYHVLRDKLITLENDGAEFVLRGKHFGGNREKRFSTKGVYKIGRVTSSDGSTAKNSIMEIKTSDGLRFMMGFNTMGSMNQHALIELGSELELKTKGNLKAASK